MQFDLQLYPVYLLKVKNTRQTCVRQNPSFICCVLFVVYGRASGARVDPEPGRPAPTSHLKALRSMISDFSEDKLTV